MTSLRLLPLLALTLVGCGLREPLALPPEAAPVATPAMARRPLTTDEMLTPPPIARPERVDELLRRSEEREDDRFDLPPADVPEGGDPVDPDGDGPE